MSGLYKRPRILRIPFTALYSINPFKQSKRTLSLKVFSR